jgi:hypothetical protein
MKSVASHYPEQRSNGEHSRIRQVPGSILGYHNQYPDDDFFPSFTQLLVVNYETLSQTLPPTLLSMIFPDPNSLIILPLDATGL